MQKFFLSSKIHNAKISAIELDYEGSLSIDEELLEASNIAAGEQIHVLNSNNGERFITYAITAPRGSKTIQVNGAAARLCATGDSLIIISYVLLTAEEALLFQPKIVHLPKQG